MMFEINLLNIYLSTCGVIAIGMFISFIYEYLFRKPDIKFGYSLFSPVSWGMLAVFSIPFINIVSFLIAIYICVKYQLGFIREGNLKKLHSDQIEVPMHKDTDLWYASMCLNRCAVCHSRFSDYVKYPEIKHMHRRGTYSKEISCKCGHTASIYDNAPDHELIDEWNKLNPIEVAVKEVNIAMNIFERLWYHLSLSRKRNDIIQKKLDSRE